MERWYRSPGYVYFLGVGERPTAIKIGISTQRDIRRRMGTLQCGNPEPLVLLGVIPFEGTERPMADAEQAERELHSRFAPLRLFRKGWAGSEWFASSAEILELIRDRAVSPSARNLPKTLSPLGPGRRWTGGSPAAEPGGEGST
jgi:hypothetical protein